MIHRLTATLSVLSLVLFFACTSNPKDEKSEGENPEQKGLNFEAMADLIMERMDLQPGEKVLLVATPGRFDPMVAALNEKITNSPGEYLGAMSVTDNQPEAWLTPYINESAAFSDEELQEYLKHVDIGIMMPGPNASDKIYGMIQQNLNEGIRRTIHFHWAGAYDFNGNLLDDSDEIDEFYQNVLLTTDYAQLAEDQQRFEDEIRGKQIRVTTPSGTDISFEVGDRPVTKQSGDASAATATKARNLIDREMELPAGAIRVAPIESSVNGTIAFPDAQWGDTMMVRDLVLTFEEGKVTAMEASNGIESVEAVMNEAGEVAKSFREFALGMNPELAIPEENPWIPYYGYGAGVVRLSLGDNSELGGNVTGGFVRWNFFPDASVSVDGEVWVQDGKLIK